MYIRSTFPLMKITLMCFKCVWCITLRYTSLLCRLRTSILILIMYINRIYIVLMLQVITSMFENYLPISTHAVLLMLILKKNNIKTFKCSFYLFQQQTFFY